MIRIFSILAGAFFSVALLWSFGKGASSYVSEPPKPTVESVYHKHAEGPEGGFSFEGAFGKFDKQQLQRGFQVYTEVCATCHALKHVAFRDLKEIGYNEAEIKAIAAKYKVPEYNATTGEVKTHDGVAKDHFPPVVYGGQGSPPDLSLIAKARHGGPNYIYALLTGYQPQPAEVLKQFPDAKIPAGLNWNPYFANLNIAMPQPLVSEGQVSYKDGTKPTVEQMSADVSAFLMWTAEPKLEKRNQTGWPVLGFLLFAMVLAYMSYRTVWADKKH
ncbi:cytochrome c1 [Novosphingobium sp. FSY-8]|uniref:Cytochrome c1 n=1 Tax=Novosphingobium ovatum TaxID=1908523 RepID=A0ABW9XEI1_9SPHN|nr:cytochrome c1 [Novosphingobium ovatum]NBC36954.1 cytochrome c1 [Novosphingobium ovatum]